VNVTYSHTDILSEARGTKLVRDAGNVAT